MKLFSSASVRFCVLCVSAFSFPVSVFSQSSPRPITLDDIFQIQSVHDPQLSPDSRWKPGDGNPGKPGDRRDVF